MADVMMDSNTASFSLMYIFPDAISLHRGLGWDENPK